MTAAAGSRGGGPGKGVGAAGTIVTVVGSTVTATMPISPRRTTVMKVSCGLDTAMWLVPSALSGRRVEASFVWALSSGLNWNAVTGTSEVTR